jgi:hypothetical protein
VSPVLVGGGKARLRGTAAPGTVVEIYAKPISARHSTRIASVLANPEGNWGLGTTIRRTTSFRARTPGYRSRLLTAQVRSQQQVTARPLGAGLVRFTVVGEPAVPGVVTIYDAHRQRLARVGTSVSGTATVVVRSAPGRATFRIYFRAPGTLPSGRSLTGTVL